MRLLLSFTLLFAFGQSVIGALTGASNGGGGLACQSGGQTLTGMNGSIAFSQEQAAAGARSRKMVECHWTIAPNDFLIEEIAILFANYDLDPQQPCSMPLLEAVYDDSVTGKEERRTLWTCKQWPYTDREIVFKTFNPVRLIFRSNSADRRNSFELDFEARGTFIPSLVAEKGQVSLQTCGKSYSFPAYFDAGEEGNNRNKFNSVRGSWPWVVQLFNSKQKVQCVGAIIEQRMIVTAASCFLKDMVMANWIAVVGLHSFDDPQHTAWDNSTGQMGPRIRGIYRHSRYAKPNVPPLENDIAIVALSDPIPFGVIVRPICLPQHANASVPTTCFAMAYDRTVRQMVDMKFDLASCEKISPNPSEKMFCAGISKGPSDVCEENTGSPLVCIAGDRWELHGIKSASECNVKNAPGAFTKVSQFLSWLGAVKAKVFKDLKDE